MGENGYLRISLKWYRSYRSDSTGTKSPIFTLSNGTVRKVSSQYWGMCMPTLLYDTYDRN